MPEAAIEDKRIDTLPSASYSDPSTMGRRRTLDPKFFTDEALISLSPLHRLLFLGLLTEADRLGRAKDMPRQVHGRVLPMEDVNVDQMLDDLHRVHLIQRYEKDGIRYFYVPNFLKYQHPHPREAQSVIPPPDPDRQGNAKASPRHGLGTTKVRAQPMPRQSGSTGSTVKIREASPLPLEGTRPDPEFWAQILEFIETQLPRHQFHSWFKRTQFLNATATVIRVLVPNQLTADWIKKHYGETIQAALVKLNHPERSVLFVSDEPTRRPTVNQKSKSS